MMDVLVGKLDDCGRRLRRFAFLRASGIVLFWLAIALCAAVLTERALNLGWPVAVHGYACAGAILFSYAVGAIVFIKTKPDRERLAAIVDSRLGLKERVTSFLQLRERGAAPDDPVAGAVMRDAMRCADSVIPEIIIPLKPSWKIRIAPILLSAYVLLGWLLPPLDLRASPKSGNVTDPANTRANTEAIRRRAARILETTRNKDLKLSSGMAEDLQQLSEQLEKNPDTRELMVALNELADKAEKARSELAPQIPQFDNRRLNSMATAEGKSVAEAMKNKDFAAAAEKLSEMADKLRKDGMTQEEREKMAQDLRNMAAACKNNPALSDALNKAAQAVEQGNDAAAQDALQEAAKQLQRAQQGCEEMAGMNDIAKSVQAAKSQMGQRDNCGVCGKQLSEEEKQQGESVCKDCREAMEQMENATAEGEGAGSQGEGLGEMGVGLGGPGGEEEGQAGSPSDEMKLGETDKPGPGMGGPGKGKGGGDAHTEDDANVNLKPSKISGKLTKGKILGNYSFKDLPKSENELIDYRAAYLAERAGAEKALAKEPIPLDYKELVKDYFDSISPSNISKPSRDAAPSEGKKQ
ncbi:MAG TPA: hypothetical protein PL033_20125 [Candidatus Brocadiia bacterium]|nr:hypothetical protein [Candidatus Brocadiia bacterium]